MRRLILLTAAGAIMAFCVGRPMAHAADGPGRGGEGGKGKNGPDQGPRSGPKAETHGETHEGRRLPPSEIPHEGGVSIFGGTEKRPDGWRYRYEHDGWWYWSPKNHWMFYDGGKWDDYSDEGGSGTVEVPVQSDPNYYWFHDHWWYLRGDHWSYFDHDHWGDAPKGMSPPHRDEHHGEPKKDDHGPRRDEHEGSKK